MCGIAGIVHGNGAPVDAALLWRMVERLKHRGPDDSGVYAKQSVGFAHTRLSIIDLSEHGHQPMLSADGRFALAYNGEVYNARELGRELSALGHQFRGHSDTEVVLAALVEWGSQALVRFEGMFALALWDNRERRLLLARDRFGIKPLYYHSTANTLVFGSEIKAVLACAEVEPRADWAGIHEYLQYSTTLGPRTAFSGIRKLLPGQRLERCAADTTIDTFASIHDVGESRDDYASAADKVKCLLARAVQSHLVTDVDVGVFLSGGIDSSAIVAFGSQHGPLRTFSAGFDFDRGVDELPIARQVAERFGTDHHELHITGTDVPAVIERLVAAHDAPFGDAANIPLFLLAEQVAGQVKVILQGDGGDEMFGGYPRYALLAGERWLRTMAPPARWTRPIVSKSSLWNRRLCKLENLNHPDPALRMALLMSEEPDDEQPPARVFSADVRSSLAAADPFRRYKEHYRRLRCLDPVQRALHTDAGIILPDVYFEKVDRATMAHGVEVRVPFVDTQLAAYAMALPSSFKVGARAKKRVLRQALRGIVPDAILDRPKEGLNVPMAHWLRTSLVDYLEAALFDDAMRHTGLFDQTALARCVHEHKQGRRDNGKLLYKLLNFALWWRTYQLQP